MPCYECRHIRANGHKCRALAMQETHFCWFHHQARKRAKPEFNETLTLPVLEDQESIQVAVGDVLTRLASGRLDARNAGVLLYGLQIASKNLRGTHLHSSTSDLVTFASSDPHDGDLGPLEISTDFYIPGEKKASRPSR